MTNSIETCWFYLPPSAKLAVEKMQRNGFVYYGIESDFSIEAIHHKGWILEQVNYDDRELLIATWEETGDAWSFELSWYREAFVEAVADTMRLIDDAEREYNFSPGQLSLFSP